MGVRVMIPAPLRPKAEGAREVVVDPGSLAEVLGELEHRYPALADRLRQRDTGELRRTVNIYLNQQNVRFLDGLRTSLRAGDELAILMAVAGGS